MKPSFLIFPIVLGLAGGGLVPSAGADELPAIRPGDRVAIVGNTFADQLRIHGYLETLLLQHSATKPISVRNLGWGGDMLTARDRPTGFPTEESTLIAHRTDVIIACFGMGESFAGQAGVEGFRADLKAFIASHAGKKYNGESEVRLVLVSPISYEFLGQVTPALEKRNGELEAYTWAMGEVAREEGIPFVNLFEPSRYLMEQEEGARLTTNGIHLNSLGYWAISRAFFENLVSRSGVSPAPPWRLRIDARSREGEARGVLISGLAVAEGGIRFQVEETSGPTLAPPTKEGLSDQLEDQRDYLVVVNLAPGEHTLTIDGEEIVTASHEDWAQGVPVDSSPAHQAGEELRAAINDKNLQFTYSWKALNQVHIVGERRKSPSGKALPAEVVEFNRLANQRDEALPGMIQRSKREWRLSPAEN